MIFAFICVMVVGLSLATSYLACLMLEYSVGKTPSLGIRLSIFLLVLFTVILSSITIYLIECHRLMTASAGALYHG